MADPGGLGACAGWRGVLPGGRGGRPAAAHRPALLPCPGRTVAGGPRLQFRARLVSLHPGGHPHRSLVVPVLAFRRRGLRPVRRASVGGTGRAGCAGRIVAAVDGLPAGPYGFPALFGGRG